MEQLCKNCKYFRVLDSTYRQNGGTQYYSCDGICCRYPRTEQKAESDFCGEWTTDKQPLLD